MRAFWAQSGNRAVTNIFGNAVAPFASEVMDAAMRGEDDPNTERQDFSIGDALMGMATNTEDESVIEADFARIEALFNRIRTAHPAIWPASTKRLSVF